MSVEVEISANIEGHFVHNKQATRTSSVLWHGGIIGQSRPNSLTEDIIEQIEDRINQFLLEYYTPNTTLKDIQLGPQGSLPQINQPTLPWGGIYYIYKTVSYRHQYNLNVCLRYCDDLMATTFFLLTMIGFTNRHDGIEH